MKISNYSKLASATFAITLLCLQPGVVQAGGGQTFSREVTEDNSKDVDLGTGKFSAFPFHVSVTVRGGYDDNVNLSSINEQGSAFTSAQVGLTYNFGSPRTSLSLNAGGGVTYYFDRDDTFGSSDSFDSNGFISFAITHKATPRLTLAASLYATYQSQPDFETFNLGAVNFSRQSQDFFFTVNKFSAAYAWAPRFSTLTSYTLGYTDYVDDVVSRFEDRFEHTIGNEFRFLIWPTTTLVGEYRFGIVDYTYNDGRSSTSHYFLAGFDHQFSPRFNVSFRGGVEVRNYDDDTTPFGAAGEQTSPYFESTLNYAIAQNTSVSWTNRYSLEEPDIPDTLSRTTFRTGLTLRHNFTARISAGINAAYEHDENDGNLITRGFDEDSFQIQLWGRYVINRNFSLDVGYDHTEVISDIDLREYARNRFYGGVTFTF